MMLRLMIRRGEVSQVSALFFLIPPMAALIGWPLLDELMPSLARVGLGLDLADAGVVCQLIAGLEKVS